MSTLIAALAQINPTVGALHANAELVIQNIIRAADQQAGLVIFPELCLSGYPPEDLVLKPQFLDDIETQLDRLPQPCRRISRRLSVRQSSAKGASTTLPLSCSKATSSAVT